MVKGKRLQNTVMSPPHKNNYIWDEESQIIFVLVAQKFLLTLALLKDPIYAHCLLQICSTWEVSSYWFCYKNPFKKSTIFLYL